MDIIIRNTGETPIYDQITRQVKTLILTGALCEGEALPSMRALAKEGLTMIIVTHEMAFARDVSSHVVFMADGVIVEEGKPEQIFEAPRNQRTQEFLSRFRQG